MHGWNHWGEKWPITPTACIRNSLGSILQRLTRRYLLLRFCWENTYYRGLLRNLLPRSTKKSTTETMLEEMYLRLRFNWEIFYRDQPGNLPSRFNLRERYLLLRSIGKSTVVISQGFHYRDSVGKHLLLRFTGKSTVVINQEIFYWDSMKKDTCFRGLTGNIFPRLATKSFAEILLTSVE